MENEELLQRAEFGRQVELFWGSRIGEYLRGRAQEVYTAAIEQLKVVDPTDTKAIVKAQADVFRAESFEVWLSEAVVDGLKSLDLLENQDE